MFVVVASALSPSTSPAAYHRVRSSSRYSLLFTSPTWRRSSHNMVHHCTSTLMTVRYMAHVGLMPPLCSLLQCHGVLTLDSIASWIVLIASNSIPTRQRWLWCASTRKLQQLPSLPLSVAGALVCPVNAIRDMGVFIDNDLGAATHVQRTVSRCFAALRQLRHLRRYVTDDCFRSRGVACAFDSTTVTSSLSGFLFIYSGASSPFSTLRLVWYFDYVVTTMSPTPLQLCTGCVYHNVLTSRWLSWRYGCHMVTRHHTWISWFVSPICPVVADFGQHRHTNCSCYHSGQQLSCSRCITRLELIAIRHPSIFFSVCLPSTSEYISFRQSFPDIVLWSHYALVVYAIVLLF